MKTIQILGTGCKKCADLATNVKQAAADLGLVVQIEKITDINQIITFGCMTTPALAVDGQLLSQGKVLKAVQIAELIKK
ncbi:MAG: thioredoxin family protein [Thermodesulfobacteriota bacterium]|nr:thioredoxin family protein [Thermodesulfobacteriota bacterium]